MPVTSDDLSSALSPKEMSLTRIIIGANIAGPVLFLAVVAFVALNARPREAPDHAFVQQLTMVCLAVAAGGLGAALFVPRALLRAAAANAKSAQELASGFRTAAIVRSALTEGGALFGGVVLLIAGKQGDLGSQSGDWLNLLPVLSHIALGVAFWPSRDSWLSTFRELR